LPPQTLWDHGCGDHAIIQAVYGALDRHKLFGITGAATTASAKCQSPLMPPQTLWDHGCGDQNRLFIAQTRLPRHKLFGITGAATGDAVGDGAG